MSRALDPSYTRQKSTHLGQAWDATATGHPTIDRRNHLKWTLTVTRQVRTLALITSC